MKELRLRAISDMAEGNAYLPEFVAAYNAKFAVVPQSNRDAHRPLRQEDDLGRILTLQSDSRLSKNLTLQHDRLLYQITEAMPVYRLRHQKVLLRESEDGNVVIDFHGKSLDYRIYHRAPKQGQIASVKELDATLSSSHPAEGTESIDAPTLRYCDVQTPSDKAPINSAKIPRASKRKPVIPPYDHPWRASKRREIENARLHYLALKNVRERNVAGDSTPDPPP